MLLTLLTGATLAWANPLLEVPLDDEVYELLDRLQVEGVVQPSGEMYPLSRGEVVRLLGEALEGNVSPSEREEISAYLRRYHHEACKLGKPRRYFLEKVGPDFLFYLDPQVGLSVRLRDGRAFPERGTGFLISVLSDIGGSLGKMGFMSHIEWYLMTGRPFGDLFPDETRVSYRREKGDPIDADNFGRTEAYMVFPLPHGSLLLGRGRLRWGPGRHGALLLSGGTSPWDMLRLRFGYRGLGFEAFTAVLRGEDSKGVRRPKYLSGHRLEARFGRFQFGVSETVVYGDRFEPSYLNPFSVYLITEQQASRSIPPEAEGGEMGSGDNVLAGVDAGAFFKNFKLYCEILVDDYRPTYSPKHWRNKYGLLGGFHWADPLGLRDSDLRVEYAFVNQYCYTHERAINRYKHLSRPIGHPMGSDADDLRTEFEKRFGPGRGISLYYERLRKGEGSIDGEHGPGDPDRWEFLSGTEEVRRILGVRAFWREVGERGAELEVRYLRIRNFEHVEGRRRAGLEVLLSLERRL